MKTQNKPASEITESTQAQTNPEIKTEESNNSNFWHTVLVGGIPGIIIGASGAVATKEVIAGPRRDHNDGPINGSGQNQPENVLEVHIIPVAHSVNDDMSFNEAFAAARAEVGPGGAFTWHGNVYSTYRADDPAWQEMSDEQRSEHGQLIMSQVHPTPYSPTVTAPHVAAANVNGANDEGHDGGHEEESHGEVDVHIVGVTQVQTEDGTVLDLGYGEMNGHEAMFVDSDGDGEVDTVYIDLNDNSLVDNDERITLPGPGPSIASLAAEAQANGYVAPDDSLYGDMPDYTNDADTGSYV